MLSIIPTPVGNKEDITLRGLRLFKELDTFFCEDTRTTQKLFSMYDISLSGKKLYAFTSHISDKSLLFYTDLLQTKHCWLLSEAGTPGLSDPGKELVKLCREQQIPFEILPGANALLPAVVATPTDTSIFSFHGFLPVKKGRQTKLTEILQLSTPTYVYESVHRIEKLLQEVKQLWYTGQVLIARELTKLHEQYLSGNVDYLLELVSTKTLPLKGEFVVCFFQSKQKKQK